MLADFTIHVHDCRKPMAVRVKVHDSVAALRSAATKWDRTWPKRLQRENTHAEDKTLGVCHRFHMLDDPVVAIVRLAPPHVGAGVVAHELTHAAVWLWEIENKFENVPINCLNDEWFCTLLGELVRQTTNELYARGVYEASPENYM